MAKQKRTLQDKLAARKYKVPNKVLYWFFIKFVVKPFLSKKYNVKLTKTCDMSKEKGPCFVVYNHQSRFDYIMSTLLCYPKRLNFVVGYNEFFRGHLQLVFKLMHMIPKKNFNSDAASIRAMDSIIKQGGNVCIAPEGMSSITGHNQPVAVGTGKLLKRYHIPVYMVKSKGAYLSNHKVCLDDRIGLVEAELTKLFDPSDFDALSPSEIEAKLNEALWQDDYLWNKERHIKYKTNGRICTHLHDICYRCPKCGAEFEMIGEGDTLKCKKCGNGAKMDDYYDFHPFDDSCVIPYTPTKWVDEERKLVYHEIQDPNFEFVEHVKLGKLPEYHYVKHHGTSELCGDGEIRINHNGFFYKGTKDGEPFEYYIDYLHLPTIGMVTDVSFFALYFDGKYYDLFPERPSVYKILLIVEEMHRLHVNSWKNFPWADTYE